MDYITNFVMLFGISKGLQLASNPLSTVLIYSGDKNVLIPCWFGMFDHWQKMNSLSF